MKWDKYPITKITLEHKDYPIILRELKNPPKVLFYRGNLNSKLFTKSIAVVGSRRITHYGKSVTEKLVGNLAAQKVTIISGFMYGVDTEAHWQSLQANGTTIAVLGNGLNIIYPPENEKLYQQILDHEGLIISEYEPNLQPHLWTFPQRNRIVAGLATLGVLVIEAGVKSGSLITARLARQQGKKVFAVPGPIISVNSVGTNNLIKNHQAKMVLGIEDILGKKIETPSFFADQKLIGLEKTIFTALETEPLTPDELALLTGKNIIEVTQILSMMSLKNLVSESAGKYYLNS